MRKVHERRHVGTQSYLGPKRPISSPLRLVPLMVRLAAVGDALIETSLLNSFFKSSKGYV